MSGFNEHANIDLQDEKLVVDLVSGHGGLLSFTVGNVVPLEFLIHLVLLQKQQKLKLLVVVLPAQSTFYQGRSEQNIGKENTL